MTGRSGSVQWIAGTALACLLALVASWLLVLGPMLDEAAATREQAAGVRAGNEALQASLEALRAESQRLPEYETELAALRLQMPDEARLAELTREISAAAAGAGVTVVALDVSAAVRLTGAQAAAPTDGSTGATDTATDTAPTDTAATDNAATDTAASDTAVAADTAASTATDAAAAPRGPAPAPPVPGMVAIPLAVKVVGSVEPVRAFLTTLQTGLQRQLLVSTLGVLALEESQGDESRPASQVGDVEATIGAYAYVLPPDEQTAAEGTTAEGTASSGSMPATSGGSPFSPSVEAPAPAPVDPAQSMADAVAAAIAEANAQAQAQAAANAQAQAEAVASAAAAAAAAATQAATGVPQAVTEPPIGTDG
jgi:Tfp pilus assembly protein PilO